MARAAARLKVRISGAEELDRKLQRLPEQLREGARDAVREEVHDTAQDLRRTAPVLTGNLRDSIKERLAKKMLTGTVAITAKYTEFVINGTEDTPANDFVSPVLEVTRRRFPDRLRRAVHLKVRK